MKDKKFILKALGIITEPGAAATAVAVENGQSTDSIKENKKKNREQQQQQQWQQRTGKAPTRSKRIKKRRRGSGSGYDVQSLLRTHC